MATQVTIKHRLLNIHDTMGCTEKGVGNEHQIEQLYNRITTVTHTGQCPGQNCKHNVHVLDKRTLYLLVT